MSFDSDSDRAGLTIYMGWLGKNYGQMAGTKSAVKCVSLGIMTRSRLRLLFLYYLINECSLWILIPILELRYLKYRAIRRGQKKGHRPSEYQESESVFAVRDPGQR